MSSSPKIIKTRDLDRSTAIHIRHPLNPNPSDIYMHPISQQAGLQRQVVSLGRLPPGQESFLPHAHTFQEEFVFILEGSGLAIIGDEEYPVGAGDFVAYPCDGVSHQLKNNSEADLVYLMGGERTPVEIAKFPSVKMVGVFTQEGVTMYEESEGRKLGFADYVAKD